MDISDVESSVKKDANSEISLPDIDSKLAELKFYETDLQNEEVTKAKQILHTVFDPKLEWFQSRDIIVTYHGSLQYNDPRDRDVDIDFIGENIIAGDLKEMFVDKLQNVWPRTLGGSIDLDVITVDDIKRDLERLEDEDKHRLEGEEGPDVYPELNASIILSSAVLFESQKSQLEVKRQEVRSLIANNPRLREGVLDTLTEVIKTRKERREEISSKPR